jgi:hypothetical protein
MPFKGSEIYLESLVKSLCAHAAPYEPPKEFDLDDDRKQRKRIHFIKVTNSDLFPRLTGHQVVSSPPIKKPSNVQSSPLNPFSDRSQNQTNGRRRSITLGGGSVQIMPMGVAIGGGKFDYDQDEKEDKPHVPYRKFTCCVF